MKKRIIAALLCAAMALSVVACGNGDGDTEKNNEKEPATPPTITSLAAFDDLKTILTGDYAVTDKAVANYFNSVLCGADAGLIEVKDRTEVQKGDIVQVDYKGYLNGTAFEGGEANNQIIDVSNNCAFDKSTGSAGNTYIENFSDGIIGAKIDEPEKHDVTFPTNYSNTDLAGKQTTFEFNVDKIYVKVTPDNTTDEYIKEHLGDEGYTTIESLVNFSKEELVASMAMGYVIDKSKVDISEEYLNERLTEYEDSMKEAIGGSVDLSTAVQYSYGMTLEQIRPYWLQYIEAQVVAEVVFAEVVKSKNLAKDEDELKEFLADVMKSNSSFKTEDDVYVAIGYGNIEKGKEYIMNEFAVKDYILQLYSASQAVTQ